MKFLLAAVNAKYIHSNPAVYSLRAYAGNQPGAQVEIGEYTINQQPDQILQDIYGKKPDFIGFSCYIWNIRYVLELAADLCKILPEAEIWLGGPEVSFDSVKLLKERPEIRGIMRGEGEETFLEVVRACLDRPDQMDRPGEPNRSGGTNRPVEPNRSDGTNRPGEPNQSGGTGQSRGMNQFGGTDQFGTIRGITYRLESGEIRENPSRPPLSMDELPFYYESISGFEHRIIYYESSRGCPFSCSYCLSSIDKTVRFRSLNLVKKELDFFLEKKVPQVKFVDRTFNCKRDHTLGIWKHILENDNGVTNFHFEISADLIDQEELELIAQMRPGLIQLEIGVQSTNPWTVAEIRRKMDLDKLRRNVEAVHDFRNTHQHLDLIAGLPEEGFESFLNSFDDVYRMKPDQLQLGFLKVLKGSRMEEMAAEYGLRYRDTPPYEVLSTHWLDYGDLLRLKGVEEMAEVYYNSGQFPRTVELLERDFSRPAEIFLRLSEYYRKKKIADISHSRIARYEILYDFIREEMGKADEDLSRYRDALIYDLYLRENLKSRPAFASDQTAHKRQVKEFFIMEGNCPVWLTGYEGYDSRQLSKMAHLEAMEDGTYILFDYKNRDPLNWNARTVRFRYEGVLYGEARDKEGQAGTDHRDFKPPGQGIWHRIPLLSES